MADERLHASCLAHVGVCEREGMQVVQQDAFVICQERSPGTLLAWYPMPCLFTTPCQFAGLEPSPITSPLASTCPFIADVRASYDAPASAGSSVSNAKIWKW